MATATTKDTSVAAKDTTVNKSIDTPGITPEVQKSLSDEINSMLIYASRNGLEINTDVVAKIQDSSVEDLITAHNIMCKNVAPATPKSINYTRQLYVEDKSKSLFVKLPLIRNLIVLSLIFLLAFVGTALSPMVNNDSLDLGVLNNDGLSLLINLGFLSSIAGLGVTFYLLKSVSASVKRGTLVPEDSIYYIALIVLGVIAGLIMSEIISFYSKDPSGINLINKSILALIGGFSSDAIFSVLQSLIDKVKAIFSPNQAS